MNITDNIFFFSFPSPIVYWSFALVLVGTFVSGILIGSIGVGGVAIVPMLVLIAVDGKIAVTSSMFAYIFVAISAIIMHAKRTKLTSDNVRQLIILCSASFPTAILAGYILTFISANVAVLICASVALITSVKSLVEFGLNKCKEKQRQIQEQTNKSVVENLDNKHSVTNKGEEEVENNKNKLSNMNQRVVSEDESTDNGETDNNSVCSSNLVDSVVFVYIGLITGFGSGLTGTSGPVVCLPQVFLTRYVTEKRIFLFNG